MSRPGSRPELAGVRVCVAGLGVTGAPLARALVGLGARVVAVDGRDGEREQALAAELTGIGVDVRLGAAVGLPEATELVITSPGWRPDSPLLVAAVSAGVPVWGDVELAWRLRPEGQPWLAVTGTNGKTTAVQMLAAILGAAGHRAVAAGNVGFTAVEAVLAQPAYDVLAVEVSSFQLHWTSTVEPAAGAILNVADDHLDWHGSLEAYAQDKALVWRGDGTAVYNADDALVRGLAERRAATQGRDSIRGFTLLEPAEGQLGVVGGQLVERGVEPARGDVVLAAVTDIAAPGPHNVANALAAAALARVHGVPAGAVRAGLRAFVPGRHRIEHVATVDGVDYVNDSKATNPHSAAASLHAFEHVVWVAGGLAKGARFDDLVLDTADRLRGVVLMGRDRALVAEALARHAPDVPVVDVVGTDTGAMVDVVGAAAGLARPGDTVLLAPACASMDMFRDYAARGDAFATAVRALTASTR